MSKTIKKIFAVVTTITVAVMLVGPAGSARALTAEELQQQINQLLEELNRLRAQLAALEGGEAAAGEVPAACSGVTSFDRNLTVGMRGDDVKCLQALLNTDSDTKVAESGAGSPGNETTYFGPLTKAAVIKFQEKYADEVLAPIGLTAGTGFVGPKTRAKLNELLSAGVEEPGEEEPGEEQPGEEEPGEEQPAAVEEFTVSLAEDTPASGVIPGGSLYNAILKVNFTAADEDVTVTGITVTRGGYISNTSITGVSAWDENGNRLGNIVTALTSDGKAAIDFGSDDLVVPAGETESVTIKVNLASSTQSGTLNLKVASASDVAVSGDVTVSGTFPIVSNTMSITVGDTLGDVVISAQSPGGASSNSGSGNVKVGDTDVTIGKFRFTQNDSDEAIQIERLVFYIEGTVNEDKDLTNFRLYAPDGTLLASADKAVDRYVTFKLDTPYTIDKGLTKDLTVKADITDGSTHWFRVQLQNDYDVMIKGVNSGAYLLPQDSDGGTFGPLYSSSGYFVIKQGALTVSKAASSPSGSVSPGDQDVVLAKFNLTAAGEKLEIRQMKIAIANSGPTDLTGSVKVKDADTGIAYLSVAASDSLQPSSVSSMADLDTQNLSTYIVIESGETKTIVVTGSISSNATSGNSYTVYVGKFYAKRYSSNDYTYLPDEDSYYSGNTLQVGGVSLSVNPNAAFSGKRVAQGSSAVEVGEFVLGASSADDIRISSIQINYSTTTGIQNVYLAKENGTQLGSTIGTPSSSGDTVTVNWTISKSTSEILKVFADVTTDAATGTFYVYIPADGITAYGVSSGKDASGPSSSATSNSVTIGTPTLTISRDADAPTSQIVLAGQNGVELNKIKFEADYEDLTLSKITLQLTSASSTLWSEATTIASNIKKVYLYDGDTLLNAGGTPVSNGLVSITGLDVTLPAGTEKVLTVKADISDADALYPKSVGGIKVASTSLTYLEVNSSTGLMSASDITLTSYAASNYFLFTLAAPEITSDASSYISATQSPDPDDVVGRFTITNNGSRTLTFATATIYATLSGYNTDDAGNVSNFRLYDTDGNLLASASVTLSTSTPTSTISFGNFNIPQEIAAGGSKTYIVKADTQSIRNGLASGEHAYLTLQIKGSRGYTADTSSSPSGEELYWADGVINYSYTSPAGNTYNNLLATDSTDITISGTALTY